jgi:hypothetical protein
MPAITKTTIRRLYVFVAVALAVFLLALTSVGFICHGFAVSSRSDETVSTVAGAPENVADDDAQPLPLSPEMKTALMAANDQGLVAYRSTQKSVDQYQTTQTELHDLLDQHFADLLHTAQSAGQPSTPAQNGDLTSPGAQSSEPAATPAPQMVANPKWQDLQSQINDLKARRATLAATMLPTHPTMLTLEQSLADLERQQRAVPKEIPAAGEAANSRNSATSLPSGQQLTTDSLSSPGDNAAAPAPSAASVFARLLPGWQTTADQYHELSNRLQSEQSVCYQDLNTESAVWQRKAQIPADYIATLTVPRPSAAAMGADPRWAITWCSLLALLAASLVARGAQVSEAVFRTAAEVRQRLAVSILGFLPQSTGAGRVKTPGEPRWVGRTLLAAELCLLAAVAVLAAVSIIDRQFFTHLLSNPLAACSQKFWC